MYTSENIGLTNTKEKNNLGKYFSKSFCKQLLILCSNNNIWTIYFISGLSLGSTTIVVAQMRREAKSDDVISTNLGSWMTSSHSISASVWVFLWSFLAERLGRRLTHALAAVTLFISFLIFYLSTNTTHLLIGEAIRGSVFASNLSLSLITITEYTTPRYRGFFLTVKSASVFWGVWCSNTIGTFFHWKYIGLFALICNLYAISVVFWPESPHWLASKGRFNECIDNHRWLKGTDGETEKELEKLVDSKRKYLKHQLAKKDDSLKNKLIAFVETALSKEFYKPLLLSIISLNLYNASGKMVCSLYAVELLKKVTKDESTAYTLMLTLDGLTVFGMYFGCLLSIYLRRRTILFSCSLIFITFLFLLSFYLYITSIKLIPEHGIVSISLLTGSNIFTTMGPFIIGTSVYAEMIPSESKTIFTILNTLLVFSSEFIFLKLAPYIFNNYSLYITFLIFALLFSFDVFLLYKFLLETKDKTLQEIEEYFKIPIQATEETELLNLEQRITKPSSVSHLEDIH